MARQEPVGSISRPSDYGSGYEDGTKFIWCVVGRQPQIHEVWTFGDESVTSEVHLTAQVDVGVGFFGEFVIDYLNSCWHRVPMFGRNSINGSVEWLGVPDFLRNNGPPWTLKLLSLYDSWGYRGSSTNPNWGGQSGEGSDSVSIPCNCPVCVLPVYHRRIFENTRSAARRIRDDLLQENCTDRIQSPSTLRNPIHSRTVNQRDDDCGNLWDEPVDQ